MENKHYFAIFKKARKGSKLVELVVNTPRCWIDIERRELEKKYELKKPHSKYSIFQFFTYDVENYLPGLLEGNYIKREYDDKGDLLGGNYIKKEYDKEE